MRLRYIKTNLENISGILLVLLTITAILSKLRCYYNEELLNFVKIKVHFFNLGILNMWGEA